jgi:predicted DNA-binding transcriptional regulator AlpA
VTERLLTAREVASILGVSVAWVIQHANGARRPLIPSVKFGVGQKSPVRFRHADVEAFIARHAREAA